jgi:hypothetical protein
MMRRLVLAVAMWHLFLSSAFAAEASGLKITEMAVTTKIVRGNPIDAVRRISSTSVKALYCFTRVSSDTEQPKTIKHSWFKNGEPAGDSELPVKGKQWRTYSKRPVDRESVGDWKVEVRDEGGTLLKTVSFKIN